MTVERRALPDCRYCGAAIKALYSTWWVHVAPTDWDHYASPARRPGRDVISTDSMLGSSPADSGSEGQELSGTARPDLRTGLAGWLP